MARPYRTHSVEWGLGDELAGNQTLALRGTPRFGIASEAHRVRLCGAPFRHQHTDHGRRRGSRLYTGRYNRAYAARKMIDGNRLGSVSYTHLTLPTIYSV